MKWPASVWHWFCHADLSGRNETKPHEIVPGTDKPSIILAEMFVAEMLQNLDVSVSIAAPGLYKSYERASFPSFDITVSTFHDSYGNTHTPEVDSLTFKLGENVPMEKKEKDIILAGWKKFKKLKSDREAIDKETKRQERAIDALAAMMKIPTKEDGRELHDVSHSEG